MGGGPELKLSESAMAVRFRDGGTQRGKVTPSALISARVPVPQLLPSARLPLGMPLVNYDHVDSGGRTSAYIAARDGDADMIKFLHKKGTYREIQRRPTQPPPPHTIQPTTSPHTPPP